MYDANRDGLLTEGELREEPSLAYSRPAYDKDGDGSLSRDEIEAGIDRWAKSRTGAVMVPFRIQLDGRPLADAEVRLKPAPFLDTIKAGVAFADQYGAGSLGLAEEDRPSGMPAGLVPPGLYWIEIRHPSIAVPPRFNDESVLGLETFVAASNPAGVVWELRSGP